MNKYFMAKPIMKKLIMTEINMKKKLWQNQPWLN
jgi:hypothetical protein